MQNLQTSVYVDEFCRPAKSNDYLID